MGSKAIYAGIAALVGAIAAFMAVSQFLPKADEPAKQEAAAPTAPAPAPVQQVAAVEPPAPPVVSAAPRAPRAARPPVAPPIEQVAVITPEAVAPVGPNAEQLAERIRLALFRETRCPGVQQSLMVINTASQGEQPQDISQALAILSSRYDLCAAVSGGIARASHLANALILSNSRAAGAARLFAHMNNGGGSGGGDNGGGSGGGGGDTGGGSGGGGDTGGGTGGGGTDPGDVGGGDPVGGDGGPGYIG